MTITPGNADLIIYQGATFDQQFNLLNDDKTAYNLTGKTAQAQFRKDVADAVPLIELTTANGGITLGGATGIVHLIIPAATSAALAQFSGVWDLKLIGTTTDRILQGNVTLSPAVSR